MNMFLFCTGFNKDEGSIFIFTLFNLTEAQVEEDPYGAFVYMATYLGRTLRGSIFINLVWNESGVGIRLCEIFQDF